MKKMVILFLILWLTLLIVSCKNKSTSENSEHTATIVEPAANNSKYPGVIYKGNYIWCGAMNLAWGDLITNYTHGPVKLGTSDRNALAFLGKLNTQMFSYKEMYADSYYIKNGYGQGTIDVINRDLYEKYSNTPFYHLETRLGKNDIVSYSYFYIKPQLIHQFVRTTMLFNFHSVPAFKAHGADGLDVLCLKNTNRNHFIIEFALENIAERLYFAKGYPMDNPEEMLIDLKEEAPITNDPSQHYTSGSYTHKFEAPVLNLQCLLSYDFQHKNQVLNQNLRDYRISQVLQNISFRMDESGNDKVDSFVWSETEWAQRKSKYFILDKPYWVVMKNYNSDNPYLILGIKNTAFMQATKSK